MRVEQVAIPMLRAIAKRPKLADFVFRFDRWGNALGPDRYEYPYPLYDRMRADGPVVERKLYQQWFVTGHEEAKQILSSSDVIVSPQRELLHEIRPSSKLSPTAKLFVDNLLLFIDPPDHTRLRKLVSRAFSPRQISRIEPAVEQLADRYVKDMLAHSGQERRPVDVVEHFTEPLPVNVICELLGVPEERWGWAAHISRHISMIGNLFTGYDPDACSRAIEDMRAYFVDLAEQRRDDPRDDLISGLALVDEDGDRLSDDELVGMVGLLMFAGHETTSGLLGNSILALAQHPDQRNLVRDNPDLWDNAIEELLRWDTPVQTDPRTASADIEIGGRRIEQGSNILVLPGAANRDPNFYDDPNLLRLDRPDPQPVSFGHGMHHCLGHALARMETKVAMRAFVNQFGDYTIADDPGSAENTVLWKQSIVTRGPIRLPVRPGAG
ncbi:MAG: cytochrome P450 [Acidimicrobiales bacterium]